MDLINIAIFGGLVLLLVLRMLPTKGVKQITTTELKSYLTNNNIQFIDVRTPGEYKGNHIRQFKNIPLHQLGQKTNALSKEKEIVVICQSGMRSNKASKLLKKAGFKKVINVKGGMSAWN
ncbi:rhodanese-like domain-containing protein [Neobacillus sp. LXY-4]|uniref:rhodanese-like domain-containing protein n=1 Tax=Neobacillus sp. LXY-4 TaxID=3379826 RepID=UPI003EE2052B